MTMKPEHILREPLQKLENALREAARRADDVRQAMSNMQNKLPKDVRLRRGSLKWERELCDLVYRVGTWVDTIENPEEGT